jgi:hypothetical protein
VTVLEHTADKLDEIADATKSIFAVAYTHGCGYRFILMDQRDMRALISKLREALSDAQKEWP